MRSLSKIIISTTVLLLLSGCASQLTQQQCLDTDWRSMGLADGSAGNSQRSLVKEIQDCNRFGIEVKRAEYVDGWKQGIRGFCNYDQGLNDGTNGKTLNGNCQTEFGKKYEDGWRRGAVAYCVSPVVFDLGKKGGAFPNFCPTDRLPTLRAEYNRGYSIFSHLQTLNGRLQDVDSKIKHIRAEIKSLRRQAIKEKNDALNRHAIIALNSKADKLEQEKYKIQSEIAEYQTKT